jgi:hypothetical protein
MSIADGDDAGDAEADDDAAEYDAYYDDLAGSPGLLQASRILQKVRTRRLLSLCAFWVRLCARSVLRRARHRPQPAPSTEFQSGAQ